jgi:hypothetical protein
LNPNIIRQNQSHIMSYPLPSNPMCCATPSRPCWPGLRGRAGRAGRVLYRWQARPTSAVLSTSCQQVVNFSTWMTIDDNCHTHCLNLFDILQNCARSWCQERRAGGGCMCGGCEVIHIWCGVEGWCGTGELVMKLAQDWPKRRKKNDHSSRLCRPFLGFISGVFLHRLLNAKPFLNCYWAGG